MNEDWLWDRSGPPDAEIERLEKTLAPLRYRHRAPRPQGRKPVWAAVAAAAVTAVAVGLIRFGVPSAPETQWQVAGAKVRQGAVLRTGGEAITLEAAAVGRVDLAPDSELRASAEKRLTLDRGELHAFIWAPAREFVVDTPSARAVDLGCEYTLNVDRAGDGLLKVSMGWVAFAVNGKESFIPAGAQCRTRKHGGPGIPYFEDASGALREAVAGFDRGDHTAVGPLLAAARDRDALTLWHVMTRVEGQDRAAVFDRLGQLVELPREASRDAVLHGDARAIDLCWNALGLQNTGWWRGWERRWE
jgi:hypothetical protein